MRTIITWEDISNWAPILEHLVPELCNRGSIAKAARRGMDFFPADDLSWTIDLLPRKRPPSVFREEVQERIAKHFSHLRAYHGCRPKDFSTYQTKGLVPLDPSRAFDELWMHFEDGRHPEITREVLRAALNSVDTALREYRVFFEGSKRLLLDFCGHYLLYGSEYFVGILRSLKGHRDYAQLLKESGEPTLLTCDVPIDWISDSTLCELSGRMLASYFRVNVLRDATHPERGEGFGFEIFRALPSELIVSIETPANVRDPI